MVDTTAKPILEDPANEKEIFASEVAGIGMVGRMRALPVIVRGEREDAQGASKIGIGGRLATPPLPHHRAYGSVPRRFDRVRLGRAHRFGEDRATRNRRCVGLVGPPGVRTCARARLVNQLRPLRQTLLRRDGVTPRSGFAWFAIAAKDTNAIFDGSTLRGLSLIHI